MNEANKAAKKIANSKRYACLLEQGCIQKMEYLILEFRGLNSDPGLISYP